MMLTRQRAWQVGFGEPYELVIALYVRDSARINQSSDPILPQLEPAVDAADIWSASAPERARVEQQWSLWWDRLLAKGRPVGPGRYKQNGKRPRWDRSGDVLALAREKQAQFPPPREELPELSEWPELQTLARVVYRDAVAWTSQRKRELAEMLHGDKSVATNDHEFFRELTRSRKGHRSHPFALQITELPVAGVKGWRLDTHHVLISRGLRQDADACRQWLRPIVEELAWPTDAAPA